MGWKFFQKYYLLQYSNIFKRSFYQRYQRYHQKSRLQNEEMISYNLSKYEVVDLRSDTITKPSHEMKEAMMAADVGDDVYREDNTVLNLENRVADICGKEDGLFVASGTMGNLLCILSHVNRRGAEILLGDETHIIRYEQTNFAQFGGVQAYIVPTLPDGTYDLNHLKLCVRNHQDIHSPKTELICTENTTNGKVLPLEWIDQLGEFTSENGLAFHMDGARIFSASVASGVPVSRIVKSCDSVSICFSKNLGAPIGSVIVGPSDFINRCRRMRKALGGGWRQAGYLAAACIYALDHNINKLSFDHENAQFLAKGINDVVSDVAFVRKEDAQTNFVILHLDTDFITPQDFCNRMMLVNDEEERELGKCVLIKALQVSPSTVRFVTHLDATKDQIEAATSKIQYIIREISH